METIFPNHFLWGVATSAHQVEGYNYHNDSWLLEHTPGSPWSESSGDACDHYSRYREDIALFAELGFGLYRFALEWSRIQPEEDEFSVAMVNHYRDMLMACHEHGIIPMVTFHHGTSPLWLVASGGWEAKETPEKFARYCAKVAAHMGDLMPLICTINEVNGPAVGAALSGKDAVRTARKAPWYKAAARRAGSTVGQFIPIDYAYTKRGRETILEAHRLGFNAIKQVRGDCSVGLTLAMEDIQAVPGGQEMAMRMRRELQDVYLQACRGDDFIGVQTYTRRRFDSTGVLEPEKDMKRTQMGWEYYPKALEATIRHASNVTGKPVFVTENGIATADDAQRIAYIKEALLGVAACLRDGVNVQGYIYWSGLDNFEWRAGYGPTFGLVAVDRKTQKRTVKPSGHWLGTIARNGGLPAA
jgi:beta-glucosidase